MEHTKRTSARRRVQRATHWSVKDFVKSSENVCRARIIHPTVDQIRRVMLHSVATERCLWMISQVKKAFDYVEYDGKRYSGLTGPRMHRRHRGRQCGRHGMYES